MIFTELREARLDEASALSALAMRSKAHWGYDAAFMRACEAELTVSAEQIESPECCTVVADRSGYLLGYHTLRLLPDNEFELDALFVEPAQIGHGIGSLLMRDAVARAIRGQGRRIIIQGDPHATAFYRAAGATLIGERESASIPGRYLPIFEIDLLRQSCRTEELHE